MAGPTTYVGGACDPGNPDGLDDPLPTAGPGEIALILRGACAFSDKIDNAEAAGYDGVVVFNDAARGDALVSMGGEPTNLPGVFVGHSTGLAIMGAATAGDLAIELCGTASSLDCPTDFNSDNMTDGADLAVLLASWGPCGPPLPLVVPSEPSNRIDMLTDTSSDGGSLGAVQR